MEYTGVNRYIISMLSIMSVALGQYMQCPNTKDIDQKDIWICFVGMNVISLKKIVSKRFAGWSH